ncbi:hypothetical protein DES39_1205 [Orbus hercynius]|uniref:Uncharacterized protein n=1 Tax=Orbus hercynius TaxID=593135 RepID=A0A495REF5_9GAMM|nr:hypothetical protein [Orbus hercynius]RKS85789.1 hypothetical protein DES39_1205 [Orbus hercynius]
MKILNQYKAFVLVWFALWLVGCDGLGRIPVEKQDYIGTWYGQYMVLTISPNARVEYEYHKENASKSISAPITEFIGDDFNVGAFGMTTTFLVTKAPYHEDGVWKMVVDNQLVVRKPVGDSSLVL